MRRDLASFGPVRLRATILAVGLAAAIVSLAPHNSAAQGTCRSLFEGGEPRALESCRSAALSGDVDAQVVLGFMTAFGDGVAQDTASAAYWWRRARQAGTASSNTPPQYKTRFAEQVNDMLARVAVDDPDAQFLFGVLVETGFLFPQRHSAAAEWYGRAAAQGHAQAQLALAMMIEAGRVDGAKPADALVWYRRAALGLLYGALSDPLTTGTDYARPMPRPGATAPASPPAVTLGETELTIAPVLATQEPSPDQAPAIVQNAATNEGTAEPGAPTRLQRGAGESLEDYRSRIGQMSNEEFLKQLGIR